VCIIVYVLFVCGIVLFIIRCSAWASRYFPISLSQQKQTPKANTLNHRGQEHNRSLGVAICIVGQSHRLEVHSKIVNLLRPTSLLTNVGVFLVLEVNSSYYANAKSANKNGCDNTASPESLRRQFGSFFVAGEFFLHNHRALNITHWPKYRENEKFSAKELSIRAGGHMNQWENIAKCIKLIEQEEARQKGKYVSIMRLRDNSIVAKPVEYPLHISIPTVKGCAWWHGINDKMLITPRRYFHDAFRAAYDLYLAVEKEEIEALNVARNVINSESALKLSLAWKGVPVAETSVDSIPITDGRCTGMSADQQQQWCLVREMKDCKPSQPWEAGGIQYNACDGFLDKDRYLGVAVCLVGSSHALEAHSKIVNMLRPTSSHIDVDVFLVLDKTCLSPMECALAQNHSELARLFYPYFVDAVVEEFGSHPVDLKKWPNYRASRVGWTVAESLALDMLRAEQVSKCMHLFRKVEQQKNKHYTAFMTLPASSIVVKPFIIPNDFYRFGLNQPPIVQSCKDEQGFANSILITPLYGFTAFSATFDLYNAVEDERLGTKVLAHRIHSSASAAEIAMQRKNIRVAKYTMEEIPILQGNGTTRNENGESAWCIEVQPESNECLPALPWAAGRTVYERCAVQIT